MSAWAGLLLQPPPTLVFNSHLRLLVLLQLPLLLCCFPLISLWEFKYPSVYSCCSLAAGLIIIICMHVLCNTCLSANQVLMDWKCAINFTPGWSSCRTSWIMDIWITHPPKGSVLATWFKEYYTTDSKLSLELLFWVAGCLHCSVVRSCWFQ